MSEGNRTGFGRFAIKEPSRRMLGKPAWVMLHFAGRMVIRYEGRDLGF